MAGDDHPLYLRCSLSDLTDLCIAHHPFDWIVLRVTISPKNLDRLDRAAHRQFGTIQLGHRGFLAEWLLVLSQPRGVEDELFARFDLRRHVGQWELDPLKFGDRFAELLAHSGVGERLFIGPLGEAERQRGEADPPRIESMHEIDEPFPFPTQQIFHGDLDILEDQLTSIRGAPTELVFLLSGAEAMQLGERIVVSHSERFGDIQIDRLLGENEGADPPRAPFRAA